MLKKIETISSILVIAALSGLLIFIGLPEQSRADDVTSWATVGAMYTCSVAGTAIWFPTINQNAVFSPYDFSTTTITANQVIYLQVYDTGGNSDGGLFGSTTTPPNTLITSTDGTVVAGTTRYGLRVATTTSGSNNELNVSYKYGAGYQTSSDEVGQMNTQAQGDIAVASTSVGITTSREVGSYWLVSVASDISAGDYKDVVNYTCSTSP